MKFVVIGYGFVGKAIESTLSKYHEVSIYDPALGYTENIDFNADGFIICISTPEKDDGRCDSLSVINYVSDITRRNINARILIKSTVDIPALACCQALNIKTTFSPEFLRGSTGADPIQEFKDQDFAIYGGYDGRWWHTIFSEIIRYKDVRFLDIVSAGFLKYAENSFLALKVMFFNELKDLYDRSHASNFDAMIEALSLDKRIGYSHTQVPGPDGKWGFGGHCLPKDTSEFVGYAQDLHCDLKLLELARTLNKQYRKRP